MQQWRLPAMESTSAPRQAIGSTASRIATAATALCSDNQALIGEIRKSLGIIKGIAVDLEKTMRSDNVKELENTFLELLESYDNFTHISAAIRIVGNSYQPSAEATDFSKQLQDEIAKLKEAEPFDPKDNPLYRQFKEAIWKVHHEGQPMPGEEQEDIVMTSTQNVLLNRTCPLTGKPVIDLKDPIRCMDCKHIYEKDPILHYIKTKKPQALCPVAGCPKILQEGRVICDPLLQIEIDEIRSASRSKDPVTNVDDYTVIDDEFD